MITLERVRRDKAEMRWIRTLFLTAFPPEERPPFWVLRRLAGNGVDWRKIVAEGEDAGFFYILTGEKTAYIFFFAVRPELRGRHIGTEALKTLLQEYEEQTVFLAIEPVEEDVPNPEERIRRKEFYIRCGFRPTGQRLREGKMVYEVLGTAPAPEAEYRRIMRRWMGPAVSRLIPMEITKTE